MPEVALPPPVLEVIERVRAARLTYLAHDALVDLATRALELRSHAPEAAVIEAGCALGGSAVVLAAAKEVTRPLYVFDVFGMIPPPSERDGTDVRKRYRTIVRGKSEGLGGDTYYGYQDNLLERVRASFR